MSATPARDALADVLDPFIRFRFTFEFAIDRLLANPDAVLAALVEAGHLSFDDTFELGPVYRRPPPPPSEEPT